MKAKLRLVGRLYLFIFIVWGLYRLIFRLPEAIEEIILKPLVWLGPTFFVVFGLEKRHLSSLGYDFKHFSKGILKGVYFSILFFLVGLSINYLKHQSLSLNQTILKTDLGLFLLLSLLAAITEETVFRGYIQNRLTEISKNSWLANLIATSWFCLIYLPISVFVFHYTLPQAFIFLTLVFLGSYGSGILFSWTGSIWASIIIHFFWSWPVVIFL